MVLVGYDDWLTARGLSPNTVSQRVRFAESRLREWGTLDLPGAVVATWLNRQQGWTRRTYLAHFRSVYAWMVDTGQLAASPLAHYRTPPTPAPRPRPLSAAELERVFTGADGSLLAWLMLGFFAGLRAHEIAKVAGQDVTAEAFYVRGKGGQDAVLPTHPELWRLAQSYPRAGYWFPSVQAKREWVSPSQVGNKIRAHFRACGVDQGAVHRLRYSYGTTLARSGVQMRVVQELLRHRSLETTMRYVAVDDAEKRAAMAALSVGMVA
jgi:integrase/recombinase XerD